MCHLRFIATVILCVFAPLAFVNKASAQTQITQGYGGYTLHLTGTSQHVSSFTQPKTWRIYGPNSGTAIAASTGTPNGWMVSAAGYSMTVGLSPSAAPGNYTAEYCTSEKITYQGDNEIDTFYLVVAGLTVVPTPPTLPPAGNPAFSWQGTVAGVNTGNGNRHTVMPIIGWTQRGGMSVTCALYHNSQDSPTRTFGFYGSKWTASYYSYITQDAAGNNTVHWDNGLTYTFTKNFDNTYTPPIGILDKMSPYGSGRPVITTTDNTVYTFNFVTSSGQPGYGYAFLSAIADLDGNTLTIGHNPDSTLSTVTDATGRKLTYAYSGGKLASVTDPLGRAWTFTFGAAGGTGTGNLWYVTRPLLNGVAYADWFGYDSSSNITGQQSPQGHTTGATSTFGYDGSNREIWAKDPLNNQTMFTYNASNTVITDPNGHTTTHTYQYSRLASVTDALGYTSYSNYDVDNILSNTKDKRGNVWTYSSHFTNGTSSSTSIDPLGHSSSSTYNALNKVVSTVDALGNTTATTYTTDSKEDLLTSSVTGTGSAPFRATSSVGGYTNGLPTTFTDPLNYSLSVGYDANGYVNSTTDPNNITSMAVFNALGWKTSNTDALSHTTSYTYDNWGRVTAVKAPDNTQKTSTYDLDGNVLTVTDANNHTITNVYDADDRLIQTTNGRGDVVKYAYDGTGQKNLLSSKTDGNNHTTTYAYTARNEPSATYYPDGTSESTTYDPNGNTLTRTKADGSVIGYTYDAANRLTDTTYPHMTAVHFDYDNDNRKTHMKDSTGDTYWTYADGLHLTRQATPQGTVSYTYDGDGRRSQMGLAGVSAPWTYSYDNAGRLHTLQSPTDGTTTFAYDNANRLTQKTLGNSNYEVYGYDVASQKTSISYYWGGGIGQNYLTYSYDLAGNVATCDQGWYKTVYSYDGADQLTQEALIGERSPGNETWGYTYDHNGNRLGQTINGSPVQNFTYDAHDKLTSGTNYNETEGYDLNGNQTSVTFNGTTTTRTFDDEDRLTSYTVPGVGTDTFTYNGLGLRVGKSDSTGTYTYVCDGTSPGSPILSDGHAFYTPGLSENRGGVSSFYSFDRLGNMWTVDGTSQNQTYYQDTTGFGSYIALAGSNPSGFGFSGVNGCQGDADTGLVLMGHRYYDSRQGRFISQDPAGDGDNWYAYVYNNPTNRVDPLGLMPGGNGMTPMESLLVGATTVSDVFGGMDPNTGQVDTLSQHYQFYNVWKIYTNRATGKQIGRAIYLYSFAVPILENIWDNYMAARLSRQSDAPYNKKNTEAYFRGSQGNGIAQGTTGDYKDQPVPGGLSNRLQNQLHKLLDHGGNFNGGMVAEGYGTLGFQNWMIGAAAISESSGHRQLDDFTGQGIFSGGWNYGYQLDMAIGNAPLW